MALGFLVVAATVASAAFDASSDLHPVDLSVLGAASDTLISTRWADAFASPAIQVGPLQLALIGILRMVARTLDVSPRTVFSIAFQSGIVISLMLVVRRLAERWGPVLPAAAGGAAILGGLGWVAYISGHPEEPLIGLLWIAAGIAARGGRGSRAGLVLGLSVALKLSGSLGLPLLLLVRDRRQRAVALTAGLGITLLAYGPFFLFGDVQTFAHRWPVDNGLWLAVLGEPIFPWPLRVVQGALIVGAGVVTALTLRRSPGVVWAVPLVLVAVRIVTDPQPHHYFWLPFEASAIVGATTLLADALKWQGLLGAAAASSAMAGRYLAPAPGLGVRLVIGSVLMRLAAGMVRHEADLDPAPPRGSGAGGEEAIRGPGGAF